ncbi:hypothetical protein MRX96_020111 [Rhipicephalus microplus]
MVAAPGKQPTPARSLQYSSKSPWLCETQLPFGDGLFQLMNVLSAAIVLGNYLLHSEIFLLTAGVMDHWCRRPDSFANLSVDEWKQLAIPVDKNGEYSHCTIRDPPHGGAEARIVRCSSWEYDYTQYGNNIVSAWDLVCDRLWLVDFARLVYAAASVIPMAAATLYADSIGRRTALFITIPVVLISGVASAMPDDLQFFMIVRAIVSASTSALVPPCDYLDCRCLHDGQVSHIHCRNLVALFCHNACHDVCRAACQDRVGRRAVHTDDTNVSTRGSLLHCHRISHLAFGDR